MVAVSYIITGKDQNHAAQDVGFVKERRPDVTQILGDFRFPGQGQRKTPVADVRGTPSDKISSNNIQKKARKTHEKMRNGCKGPLFRFSFVFLSVKLRKE